MCIVGCPQVWLWRSAADYSPRFLPTDGQIGMYGPPLQRQRCMSAKSTPITQAAPQRRELPRQSAHAVVRKSAHQLRTLVAAGIDSRAHLTRVLAQHCAHGGADRPRSLNLKRVSPCHASCTGRCTRFSNNQRVRNDNWRRPCKPMLVDPSTTHRRSARTIAGYIHCQTNHFCTHNPPVSPHQLVQLARASFRPNAATPNRNEHLSMQKNCVMMAAQNASQ